MPKSKFELQIFNDLPNEALVSHVALGEIIGVTGPTLVRWAKANTFPPVIKTGRTNNANVGETRRWMKDPSNYQAPRRRGRPRKAS